MRIIKQQIKYFKEFTAGQLLHFNGMLLLSLVGSFTEAVGLAIFVPLITGMGNSGGVSGRIGVWMFSFLGVTQSMDNIFIVMILIFCLRGVMRFGDSYLRGKLSGHFILNIQMRIFDSLTELKFSEFQRRNKGEMSSLYTGEVSNARNAFFSYASMIVGLISAVIFTLMASYLNFQLVIIALLMGSFLFGIQRILSRRSSANSRMASGGIQEVNNLLLQTLSSFKYLKTTNTFRPLTGYLREKSEAYLGKVLKIYFYNGITHGMLMPGSIVIFVALIVWSTRFQHMPITEALGSLAIIHRLVGVGTSLLSEISSFSMVRGNLDLLLQDVQNLENNRDANPGRKPAIFADSIEMKNVSLRLGTRKIIDQVNLTIRSRELVGFAGRSGSGKTTLIDLLTGLYDPTEGEISIDGKAFSTIDIRDWQSHIGIVSQEIPIFNDTILNNVALWNTQKKSNEQVETETWDALTLAMADDFVRSLPEGLHTPIGEKGVTLSGGQKQRIAIARELYKKPQVLILDEATSALDSQTEKAIQETLEALKGNVTILIVAHRLSTLQLCDTLVILEDGKIFETGPFEDLYNNPRSYFRQLWESQGLSPKGPSTRIKTAENDWKLHLFLESGKTPVSIDNISESGVAILNMPLLDAFHAGTEFRGSLEFKGQSGEVKVKLVHRYGAVLGCMFSDLESNLKNTLSEFIKNRSSSSSSKAV